MLNRTFGCVRVVWNQTLAWRHQRYRTDKTGTTYAQANARLSYQRRTARCRPGSANRAKARAKVARAQRKVRAARADFLHKASTRLVRDHDVIAVEDLAVQNMVRNRRLSRVIADCGWGPSGRCSSTRRPGTGDI